MDEPDEESSFDSHIRLNGGPVILYVPTLVELFHSIEQCAE